jgi:hypothetical protein
VIIVLFFVLFAAGVEPIELWQRWYWLAAGLLAEGAYMAAALSDPQAAAKAVDKMLSDQFNPNEIRNAIARERLERALKYRRMIGEMANKHNSAMRQHIEATASEVTAWVEQIYRLARRMDTFEENELIARDKRMVPHELRELRRRLASEEDAGVRTELEDAIQTKETQLTNLRSLENNIKRAEIQLDHTLSALATIYTQVQLIDTKDMDSGRAKRLQEDIREEVLSLQDTISSIDDVQKYQGYAGS